MINKRSAKIALLIAFAVVLAVFPCFENVFSGFEHYGANFSFLTWNTQLMMEHGEIYGFEGSPFLTSILLFGVMAVFVAANIAVSVVEDKSKDNRVTLGWVSVALSIISIVLLISIVKKIADVFLPGYGIMFGTYLAIILALGVAIVAFIDAGSNKTSAPQKNTDKNDYENIEKLSSLKELLDSGVITQEEFEEKKKQLLK